MFLTEFFFVVAFFWLIGYFSSNFNFRNISVNSCCFFVLGKLLVVILCKLQSLLSSSSSQQWTWRHDINCCCLQHANFFFCCFRYKSGKLIPNCSRIFFVRLVFGLWVQNSGYYILEQQMSINFLDQIFFHNEHCSLFFFWPLYS